jgi:hypothetical protein
LIINGTTTIERREKLESDDALVLHRAQIARIKYDHGGAWGNWTHVYGRNPLLWLLPISPIPEQDDGTYVDLEVYKNPPPELAKWDPYVHYFTTAPPPEPPKATHAEAVAGAKSTSSHAGTVAVGGAGAPTVGVPVASSSASSTSSMPPHSSSVSRGLPGSVSIPIGNGASKAPSSSSSSDTFLTVSSSSANLHDV